ncbi:MAG: hypothetical protein RLZZ156_1321 [Deinococcota bacterium]|jgi:hypothetical protein
MSEQKIDSAAASGEHPHGLKEWLLEGAKEPEGAFESDSEVINQHHTQPWWKVMCLTGVDYFSSLGYQPALAALAAGALSPFATLILVLVTLFGALPMYRRVAAESPHGQGSLSMLESLLTWWAGKLTVLVLLGFAMTGFIITITLSASDAAAHIIENPFVHQYVEGKAVIITLVLILLLGAVFLKGFSEAIGIAVVLVIVFLGLNAVVIFRSVYEIFTHPNYLPDWQNLVSLRVDNPVALFAASFLLFPQLALGLSGFETGVAVIPLVKGNANDNPKKPLGRIRNAKKLLTMAAVIMSVYLMASSIITTLIIPADEFQKGGEAYGRALAYLAHKLLGGGFGTLYDISTILILWFAGASAVAALLNLVPRYLPRYGMAPDWARANRPLVILFTAISVVVTIAFNADVTAQAGAYATGVLALFSSAAIAVTLSARQKGQTGSTIMFAIITAIMLFATIHNIIDRPDGLRIAGIFIAGIVVVSLLSRTFRSLELRATKIELDATAQKFIDDLAHGELRIIANRKQTGLEGEYYDKELRQREDHHIEEREPVVFLEVEISDASDFEDVLRIRGIELSGDCGKYRIMRVKAPAVPNAIAAFLLYVRDETHLQPHCYFTWSDGNPLRHLMRYVLFGEGDTAPITREILRRNEPEAKRRPMIHVGG